MHLSPLIFLLFAAVLLWRRMARAQKPRAVRTTRMWIYPGLLLFVTVTSILHEGFPGFVVTLVFIAALGAGSAIGWFVVHTVEFSVDKESGKVSARSSQLGALLIVGLVGLRYLADYAIKTFGLDVGAKLLHGSDAALIFSTSMLVARSAHTWIKARALIATHKRPPIPSPQLPQGGISPEHTGPGA